MALAINLVVNTDGTVNIDKVAKQIGNLDNAVNASSKNVKQSEKAHEDLGQTMGSVKGIVTALTSGFLAYKALDIAKSILNTNIQMRNYHTTLNTIIGSQQAANKHFEWLKDFAASTPFEFPELVDASVKLQGFQQDAEKYMGVLGDTSASLGKDLTDTVDMFADAAVGEYQRLMEFGIRSTDIAAAAGFKSVEEMKKASGGLAKGTEALVSILESRYKDGMKNLSMELGGMISNMSDYWTEFQTDVGDQGAYNYARAGMATVLDMMHDWSEDGSLTDWAKTTSDVMVWLFEQVVTGFSVARESGLVFYMYWEMLKVVWWQAAGVWQSLVSAFYAGAKGVNEFLGNNEAAVKFNKLLAQSEAQYAKFGMYAGDAHLKVVETAESITNVSKDLEGFISKIHARKAEFDAADKNAKDTRLKQAKDLNTELNDNAKKLKAQHDAAVWIEENITDKFLKGVEARKDAVEDEYKERKAHLDELLRKGDIDPANYNAQIIAVRKLYELEMAELEKEIAADRVDAQAWANANIYANMQNSLSAQIQLEEKAHNDRLQTLKDYVDEGLLTEQEADQYAVDSEKLKNEKIKKLRYDDLKDAEKKRDDEIEMQRFELQQKVKNASSFFEYLSLKYNADTKELRTAKEKQLDDWEKYYDTLEDLTDDFSRAGQRMISDMLFDGVKGDMKSFQAYWDSFWDSMLKSVTDAVAKVVVTTGTETVTKYFLQMLGNIGSYDVGSYEVDGDQLAIIHDKEMIIPAGEAKTFRESLEQNAGMKSLAEANPAAYASFKNAAVSNFVSGGVQHVGTVLGAGINLGVSPADIVTAMANPAFWASNAVFAGWEGAEAAAETSMGIEGNALSEKVGNFAGMLGMATGLTPAGFMGVLASKAISTVVDMAVGGVQVAMARSYAEQMATAGTVSSMFDSLADALNARPYESYLDKIETETPDISIADKYAEARDRESFVNSYYADLFNSISSKSLKQQLGFNDIDSWAANAALSLGYGRVSSGGSGFGGGSFGDRYGSGWTSEATKSLGYGTSPFGGNYSFGYNDHGIGGGDDDSDGSDGSGGDDSSGSDSSGRSRSKFHTGGYLGLRNDEGFFIGQEGEGVVSKPGMELLDAINSGKFGTDKNSLKHVEQLLTQILLKITELNQTQNEWNENGVPVVTS